MSRKRAPERDAARGLYIKSKGKLKPAEIAAQLGVDAKTVRKWKYEDQWEAELKHPRRGGQPGNKNAKGHGAPEGNTNAETHGAYSRTRWDRLTPEAREEIEALSTEFQSAAALMLGKLMAKRADLEQRIAELQTPEGEREEDAEYLDKIMIMTLPDGGKMKYINRSTAFSRRMVLEAELNRVDGRILKLVDSIKSSENERQRIEIERERLNFAKQKAQGVFNLDDSGQIVEEDEDEIIDVL